MVDPSGKVSSPTEEVARIGIGVDPPLHPQLPDHPSLEACFPHNQFQSSTTVSVYGGVEVYNERYFCVKYCSQGVQTSFYESTPSASGSLGNTIPPGDIEDPGNARADFPNASEEHNLRNISRHSRVLFERIHGTQGIWRVASNYRLKTTEPPHRRSSLSHAHHKLSAEYHRKKETTR